MPVFSKGKDHSDKASDGGGEASLTSKLTSLSVKDRESALKILGALSEMDKGKSAKAGPGRYYDPKTDKTYKQRRPVRRSALYVQTENLEKQAIAELRVFVQENELVYDSKTKATTAKEGSSLSQELIKKLQSHKEALANAKAQHKLVRETEAKGRTPKKEDVAAKEPSHLPKLTKGADGKLSWADISSDKA